MATLERIVAPALLLGALSFSPSASAQDAREEPKPSVVLMDSPEFREKVAYYLPRSGTVTPHSATDATGAVSNSIEYTGDSRMITDVRAEIEDRGSRFAVDIRHRYDAQGEHLRTTITSDTGGFSWTSHLSQGVLRETYHNLASGRKCEVDEKNREELSAESSLLYRMHQAASLERWKSATEWRSAAGFVEALSPAVDASHYTFTDSPWGFSADLGPSMKDSVKRVRFVTDPASGDRLLVDWWVKSSYFGEAYTFTLSMHDKNQNGTLDEFWLGEGREEGFFVGLTPSYRGHPFARYTPQDVKALTANVQGKWEDLRTSFSGKIAASKAPENSRLTQKIQRP